MPPTSATSEAPRGARYTFEGVEGIFTYTKLYADSEFHFTSVDGDAIHRVLDPAVATIVPEDAGVKADHVKLLCAAREFARLSSDQDREVADEYINDLGFGDFGLAADLQYAIGRVAIPKCGALFTFTSKHGTDTRFQMALAEGPNYAALKNCDGEVKIDHTEAPTLASEAKKFAEEKGIGLVTEEAWTAAVSQDSAMFEHVPAYHRTANMWQAAVGQTQTAAEKWMPLVPHIHRTAAVCAAAFEVAPLATFPHVPEEHRTEEMCVKAVSLSGATLRLVASASRSRAVCRAACEQDILAAFPFVPFDHQTDEMDAKHDAAKKAKQLRESAEAEKAAKKEAAKAARAAAAAAKKPTKGVKRAAPDV